MMCVAHTTLWALYHELNLIKIPLLIYSQMEQIKNLQVGKYRVQ
jgi:hypothetical protein